MQWHKRILSDFSLELEDQTASSYQGCIQGPLSGSGLVISLLKHSDDREEKKKEKTNTSFNFHEWTSLGVSFFEAYPTQYCCNLRARHSQVRVQIPRQAEAWQPFGDWIPRQVEAGQSTKNWVPGQVEVCRSPGIPGLADPQADWGVTTFWGPYP